MIPMWKRLSVLGALAAMASALVACAPVSQMPPPIPNVGDELSAGGAVVVGAHNVNARTDSADDLRVHANLQGWTSYAVNDRLNVFGTAFVGTSSYVGIGVGLRLDLLENERFLLGLQASGGAAFGAVGLPVAVKLTDQLTLYTHPSASNVTFARSNYAITEIVPQLPFGLWWTSPSGLGLGAELGTQGHRYRYYSEIGPRSEKQPIELAPYLTLGVSFVDTPREKP
jgi:hypothetical protein